jgi:hypothetical protein
LRTKGKILPYGDQRDTREREDDALQKVGQQPLVGTSWPTRGILVTSGL